MRMCSIVQWKQWKLYLYWYRGDTSSGRRGDKLQENTGGTQSLWTDRKRY